MLSNSGSPARKARRSAGGRVVTGPAAAQPLAAASQARTRRISDSRALELASEQKPSLRWKITDYAEKRFPVSSGPGFGWFRCVIVRVSRRDPGNLNMARVHWLNGDPHSDIDLSLEDTRVLGQLEQAPPPIRTKEEERQMYENQKDDRDPLAAARQKADLLLERVLSKAAEKTINDLIEGAVGPLSDGRDAAALVSQKSCRDHSRRQPLARKSCRRAS